MSQTHLVNLTKVQDKPVILDFNGGIISSDADALLLREVEQQIGLFKAVTETIKDSRDSRYVKHTVLDLCKQRIS